MKLLSGRIAGCALALLSLPAPAGDVIMAIDVGHSPRVPGATSASGRPEFEFNRDLSRAIAGALREQGIATRMIGGGEREVGLGMRPVMARGTRFLLSVHHDSVQPQFLQPWMFGGTKRLFSDRHAGFSLFVSRKNPDLDASLRCASHIGKELRLAGFHPSFYHADRIRGESKPFADRLNGVHYYDNLVVLKGADSPAVLLEAGVIVNREEERRLADPAARDHMAESVAKALVDCVPSPVRAL